MILFITSLLIIVYVNYFLDLVDDYYLNLLSWGSNNVIAIALHNSVYLWNAKDGQIDCLLTLEDSDYVSSVSFSHQKDPNCLAVGTSANEIQVLYIH